ncbi:MAG: YggS family pyridoxal phosphate-dependent enzyme [Jatrophihabitans sp.]
MTDDDGGRRDAELVSALGAVRARIHDACAGVGRDPSSVTLVAVTKTHPASDVATLERLGVLDVGESKDQEARAKIAELAELPEPPVDLRWHVVGRVQSNKARSVAGYAYAVHSVDRGKLARALGESAAGRSQGPLEVFVQVSLDGDPERGGVVRDGVAALTDLVAGQAGLILRGVMAVPPIGADPEAAFAQLAQIAASVRLAHPGADSISAGMSADLEAAVRNGATHVRVGSALLGRRGSVVS